MILDNTSKSILEMFIPNEKGMDNFDQILSLIKTVNTGAN